MPSTATPLTIVSAAAGWGRSTLVGAWLVDAPHPAARVALDDSDTDPARFWRYVTEAPRRAGVELDGQAAGGGTLEAGLSSLLNAMSAAGERRVLALDDFHAVTNRGIPHSGAFLVERLPETLRIVMNTRADPPIGLGRLRARAGLTLAEIPGVLRVRHGGAAPCEHVRALLDAELEEVQRRRRELAVLERELGDLVERSRRLDPADCREDDVRTILAAQPERTPAVPAARTPQAARAGTTPARRSGSRPPRSR